MINCVARVQSRPIGDRSSKGRGTVELRLPNNGKDLQRTTKASDMSEFNRLQVLSGEKDTRLKVAYNDIKHLIEQYVSVHNTGVVSVCAIILVNYRMIERTSH